MAKEGGERSIACELRLYLVADPDHVNGDFLGMVGAALAGGVTAVQLRCRGRTDRESLNLARAIGALASPLEALFVVNDRVDIALAAGAAGVHLGVDDMPIAAARRIGGPNLVIGFSPETDDQVRVALEEGADYLGIGPVFRTGTKTDAGSPIGLDAISHRVKLAGIPVVGIGGISAENARAVLDAGAVGVAVVSAISRADDPQAAARAISRAMA